MRAETTRAVAKDDEFLYYRLMKTNEIDEESGSAVDWEVQSWIYLASEQGRGGGGAAPSCFFKVAGPSEPTGKLDGNWSEAGRVDVLELVDRMRERCFDCFGGTPHVVAVSLHPALVDVTVSLEHATATMSGPAPLRARALRAWRNYHTLVEAAKSRQMEGATQRRGGAALYAEVSHRDKAAGGLIGLGYGLARFELQAALKVPDGRTKPPDDRIIAKAFNLFDADGSGAIDFNELRGVCKQIGVPMTEQDLRAAMDEIDEDGSGELDKKEFKQWFRSLAAAESGDGGQGSKLEQIKVRAILSGSSIAGLSRRLPGSARDPLVGEMALGTIMGAYGLDAYPSMARPTGQGAEGAATGGIYSISSHGSRQGGCTVDAVQLGLPPSLWREGGSGSSAGRDPLKMRAVAASVADSLIGFVSVNCGLQKVPGAGALRYGAKREVLKPMHVAVC